MPSADRTTPYSEEAEQGLLGSVLLAAERVMDLCMQAGLGPGSFYISAHRRLFEVMTELWQAKRPIDVLSVGDLLKKKGAETQVGGALYLDRLIDATPTPAHAEYYLGVVKETELLRRVIRCARDAEQACYGEYEAAQDVVAKAEQAFFNICEHKTETKPWPQAIRFNVSRIADARNGIGFGGIPTGFVNLDKLLQGLKPSEMFVLAARPSMGKTALAMNIAERIALGHNADRTQHAVGVFSLEMSVDMLALRMLCSRARVASHKIMRGYVSAQNERRLLRAAEELTEAPIYLDDTGGLEIKNMRARARRMKRKHDIALVVVDYLQLARAEGYERRSRHEEVAAVSAGLKSMAKELRVPVLVLSQLSRASEREGQRKPRLADLRDSGSIEQDADVVALLRRPCKAEGDEEGKDPTLAIVDIAKHRNGPTGVVRLNFDEQFTLFTDRQDMREPVPVPASSVPSSVALSNPPRSPHPPRDSTKGPPKRPTKVSCHL